MGPNEGEAAALARLNVLRSRTQVGDMVEVRIVDPAGSRTVRGLIEEIGPEHLVLNTEDSVEFISALEVLGFSVPRKPTPDSDRVPSPSPTLGGDPISHPVVSPEPVLGHSASSTTPTAQDFDAPALLRSQDEHEIVTPAVGGAETATIWAAWGVHLTPPTPDFAAADDDLGEEERYAFVHALNVWNYAKKVKEPERVLQEVRPLAAAARLAQRPQLMQLAGELALYGGRPDLALDCFSAAVTLGSHPALYGAAVAAKLIDDPHGTLRYLGQYLEVSQGVGESRERLEDVYSTGCALMGAPAEPDAVHARVDPGSTASKATPGDAEQRSPQQAVDASDRRPRTAVGSISRVWVREQYGFITVGTPQGSYSVYFDFASVADPELRKAVELGWIGTVTFTESHEDSKLGGSRRVATNVKPAEALRVSTPLKTGAKASSKAKPNRPSQSKAAPKSLLRAAKRLELERDLDGAERLYREVVTAGGPEVGNAVKELAWLLNRKGSWREAIELLDEFAYVFGSETRPVDNLRLHILLKGKQYAEMRIVIARLRATGDGRQRLTLLKQDVLCLVGLGRVEEAQQLLASGLDEFPDEPSILEMRDRLAAQLADPEGFDLSSIEDIGAGVDDFARYYLENSTLAGADERVKARGGDFAPDDFNAVTLYFEKIRGQRPRERADAMLTLAHMAWKVPIVAGEQELSSLLRRYFSLMAEAHAASASDPDTVRTFAAEALAYSRPEEVRREVPVLLASYLPGFASSREDKWPALAEGFRARPESWRAFLRHLPYYESRSSQLRVAAELAAPGDGDDLGFPGSLVESAEDEARRIDLRWRTLLSRLRGSVDATLVDLRIVQESLESHADEALFSLDRRRLRDLAEAVGDVQRFLGQSDYLERRASYERARSVLRTFCDAVQDQPTRVGVVGLRPFAEALLARVELDQQTYLETAQAHLTVSDALENDHYQLEADSTIKIPLLIELSAGDPPIEDVSVVVDASALRSSSAVSPIPAIHGGSAREIRLHVSPTDHQIAEKAFTLQGSIQFTALGKAESHRFSLPIRLDTESEFEAISNPFESYSGGSVVADPSMFYGREEVLSRLVNQVSRGPLGQCYVLYGQKRSGKSSVLEQVRQRLSAPVIPVKITMGELDTIDADYSFLRVCASELREALVDRGLNLDIPWPAPGDRVTLDVFKVLLRSVQRTLSSKGQEPRIVYLVDEFTYIYGYIKRGIVDESFMRQWKALMESRLINTVVVGQDSMPRFMATFPNEFGVTKDERLSYLTAEAATDLATQPILLAGKSRYRGRSLDRLLELTGCSPWFLQIVCDRLVKHLNEEHAPLVTESDIDTVARGLATGDRRLALETFDPLITAAGDAEDEFRHEDYLNVLRQVAWHSAERQGARPSSIRLEDRPQDTNAVIEELIRRDVLKGNAQGNLRIRVGLFETWLRSNRPILQAGVG